MKLLYWASAYTAETPEGVQANIRNAQLWASAINRTGLAYCITPHLVSFGIEASLTEKDWIKCTLELSRRCDGLLLSPNWTKSRGSVGEQYAAQLEGRPWVVCESLATVERSVRQLLNLIEGVRGQS